MLAFPHNKIVGWNFFRVFVGCALWCVLFLMTNTPTAAQIASTTDADGKVVFVNAEPPAEKSPKHSTNTKGSKAASNPGAEKSGEERKQNKATGLNAEALIAHADGRETSGPRATRQEAVVPPDRLERIVNEAAARHNLDPALVSSVIDVESNWNQTAISHKGALGLMQLIPSTAGEMGVRDAFDPAQNIEGGTTYLRSLMDRFHGDIPKSLAAYNAGPAAVERRGDVPNIPETRSYVKKVTADYFRRGQGRNVTLLPKPRIPVRREFDAQGHTLFTNE